MKIDFQFFNFFLIKIFLFDLLTIFLVTLSFLSPLSYFCSCSLLQFMLYSFLVSVFFHLFLFDFLIVFVSVEPSSLPFGVSSHCLFNSISSVLFIYFISSFKWLNSTCLVELLLFFLCSCSLLLLYDFYVSLKFSWFPDWFVQFCPPSFVCVLFLLLLVVLLLHWINISLLHFLYHLDELLAFCFSPTHIPPLFLSFLFLSLWAFVVICLLQICFFSCYIFIFHVLLIHIHSITDLWSLFLVLYCLLLLLFPFLLMLFC